MRLYTVEPFLPVWTPHRIEPISDRCRNFSTDNTLRHWRSVPAFCSLQHRKDIHSLTGCDISLPQIPDSFPPWRSDRSRPARTGNCVPVSHSPALSDSLLQAVHMQCLSAWYSVSFLTVFCHLYIFLPSPPPDYHTHIFCLL